MARQIINTGTTANDNTGDTLRVAGTKINENFVELYTQLGGGDSGGALTSAVRLIDSGLEYIGVTNNTVLGNIEGSEKLTILLPDSSGTVIVDSAEQNMYNKHLYNTKIDGDLRLHGTSGTGYYKVNYEGTVPSGDRNINLPALTDSDTLVFEDHTQTITNKTLNSATLNSPSINTAILDINGAESIKITATGSAANEITVANAAAGNNPTISASGTDTNIGLNIDPKGTGAILLGKVAYSSKQMGVADSDMSEHTFIVFNPTGASSYTIEDGTINGELKILLNRGSANATISSGNLAFGSSFTMAPNAMAQMIWENVETNWHLLGTDSASPNITIT